MNERTKQLAEQAEEYAYSVVVGGIECQEAYTKKFAALIIQDCIEIVEPCKCGCCDGEPESIITDAIIKQIKQHFGISE